MDKLNRTPIVIASALFAVVLWVAVNLGFEYTVSVDVPVQIQYLAEDLAIREPVPETLKVRIRGEGWKLLGIYFGGETKYLLDVRNLRESAGVNTAADLENRLKLPGGIEPLEISPTTFFISIERRELKHVPVVPQLNIEFREGFGRVGSMEIIPDSVRVEGSISVVENISNWKTKPLLMRDVREPVSRTVLLSDTLTPFVQIEPESVNIRFDVQPIAERRFSGIAVNVSGVPQNREVVVIPPTIDVIVRGGINRLAEIEVNDFSANLNYGEIITGTDGRVQPVLQWPDDIQIIRVEPAKLDYVIRRL